MWLVLNDWCGLGCALFTYVIVVVVYIGFVRIGIWEPLQRGEINALTNFITFQWWCIIYFLTQLMNIPVP